MVIISVNKYLKNHADIFNREDLSNLKVLSACIKEGLRLHTPVPLIERQTTKDMYIDGYFIPSETQVDINIYNILHNPQVWDDPMV